jgi:hypothetical protein
MPTTPRQICTDSLHEIGVLAVGDAMSSALGVFALGKLTRLLNNWNADRRAVWATAFLEFTLTPNLSPHTIGPTSATFAADQRPVSIEGAYLILNTSTPNVNLPITVRDQDWWLAQSVPDLTSTIPTDLYYQPDVPNGKLYFWPVPTVAYGVGLMARVLVDDSITLDTSLTFPPGYADAITLTLAESIATSFGRDVPPALEMSALRARSRIFANNDTTPRLQTADYGMDGGVSGHRADFNWLSGQIV